MKIAIIGATGMVGSRVTREATERGHTVDAYSRNGKAPEGVANVQTAALNFNDTQAVLDVIATHDVTLITVSGRDNYDAVREAHHNLIAAKPQGRFIVVGGAGALEIADGTRLMNTDGFPEAYLPEARTFGAVYDDYKDHAGELDWSMIAPSPEIASGKRTGKLVSALNNPAGGFVSAEDFAVAIVDEMEHPEHARERFTVASADEAAARA